MGVVLKTIRQQFDSKYVSLHTQKIHCLANLIATSNLDADGLKQQKTTLGSIPVSQEQEMEITVGSGSPKLTWPFSNLQLLSINV